LPGIERDQDAGGADAAAQCKRDRGGAAPGRASESAQGALSRSGDASAARRGEAAAEGARGDAFVRFGLARFGAEVSEPGEAVLAGGKPGRCGDADFIAGADAGGSAGENWDYRRIGKAVGRDRGFGGHYRGFGSGPAVRLRTNDSPNLIVL